jgi:hypothetical protein
VLQNRDLWRSAVNIRVAKLAAVELVALSLSLSLIEGSFIELVDFWHPEMSSYLSLVQVCSQSKMKSCMFRKIPVSSSVSLLYKPLSDISL